MSIVISGGGRKAVIIGVTTVALAMGAFWERVNKFRTLPPLVDLQLSGALFNGTASTGVLVGAKPGSTFALGGTPPAGLSIASTGGTYTFDGTGTGTGIFTITETNSAYLGSPHVTTVHWSITAAGAPDTTPDAFTLTDVTNAALSTVETSNAITVSGLGTGVTVSASISGDASSQIKLNSGSWGTGPVTVGNGDTVTVRNTSSASNSTAVNTTLTIGGVSDTFTSTTVAAVAPVLSSPTASATGQTTASLGVTTNETGGTLYWIVSTSATPPSPTQIAAGQNSSGATAAAHGSQAVSATGAQSASATGLTASTTYYAYFMHTNASSQQSNVASATSFATSSSGPMLSAATLGYPSPLAGNPTTIPVKIPVDWQSGDIFKLARSTSASMSSPAVLTHTLTDADVAAGTFSIGLSGVTLSGITYFQAYGNHSGADSSFVSNIVGWGDTVAPTISTSATQSVYETVPLAVTLAATDTGGVPALVSNGSTPGWYISGGADQLQAQIAIVAGVPTVQWYANGSQLYASPHNSTLNAANPYNFNIVAVDYSGNASAPLAMAVTVNQITVNAFTFTNVNGAPHSTLETSNTVTLTLPVSTTCTLAGTGFTISKNGGAYVGPGSFSVSNGDTLTLQDTSGSADGVTNTCTVTVAGYSTTWSVSTPGLNMLSNSTFSDTSAWTLGGGCSISGGVCHATGAGAICQQAVTTWVNGGTYQVDLDYTCTAGSKLRLNQNQSNGIDVRVTSGALTTDGASHHLTLSFTSNVTSDYLSLEADSATFTGTIDNFTCVRTA